MAELAAVQGQTTTTDIQNIYPETPIDDGDTIHFQTADKFTDQLQFTEDMSMVHVSINVREAPIT